MFDFNLLKDQLFKFLGVDNLINSFTEYVEARGNLIKKEIRDEISIQVSRIVILFVVLLIAVLTIAFLSVAAAFYLSELFNSNTYGFLCVGGIYLLFSILLWMSRDRAAKTLSESLKKKMEQKP